MAAIYQTFPRLSDVKPFFPPRGSWRDCKDLRTAALVFQHESSELSEISTFLARVDSLTQEKNSRLLEEPSTRGICFGAGNEESVLQNRSLHTESIFRALEIPTRSTLRHLVVRREFAQGAGSSYLDLRPRWRSRFELGLVLIKIVPTGKQREHWRNVCLSLVNNLRNMFLNSYLRPAHFSFPSYLPLAQRDA